jgi:hypothetical protein
VTPQEGGYVGPWIGVHGIGQQYLGRNQILDRWIPALTDGLEWATQRRLQPDLDLAFYGHLFRQADPQRKGKGPLSSDATAYLAGLDDAELADLTKAVQQIIAPADLAEAAARSSKGLWLPTPVQTLVGAVEQRFPPGSGILLLGTLRQVRRYLQNSQLKAEVDQITARAAGDATVLIGHSLGSVVAYEFLRQHPGHSVKLLLTLGSPLGLKMVRDRLPAGEPDAVHWVNVRDPNDPVTAAGAIHRWYPMVLDRCADNGVNAHAVERYLSFKATGEALKDFLPGACQ